MNEPHKKGNKNFKHAPGVFSYANLMNRKFYFWDLNDNGFSNFNS